jgi:phosphate transport system permease protein
LAGGATFLVLLALLTLLADILVDGLPHLSRDLFARYASRFPARAGIRAPLVGTFWVLALTVLIAVPISLGAAIWMEEYAPRNRLSRLVQANIANLAGVPSIVYGILGLALFVQALRLGGSVWAGALTLALLVMPPLILQTQEALRAVPPDLREGAYALGASRWQVVRHQVLPPAFPGIVSGALLVLSRAVGEAAPLLMIGVLTFIAFTPETPADPFTVLPLQIFAWVTRPEEEFRGLAAAAIIVLLGLSLALNGLAILLRRRPRAWD